MKGHNRQVLMMNILVLVMYSLTVGSIAAAEPIVEGVTLDPQEPSPLSTITFTAIISSEDSLDDVRLIVRECKGSLCFTGGFNVSMNMVDTDTYQAAVTLTHDDATYIKYNIEIESDGAWYEYGVNEINLTIDSNNGTSNGGDGGNGTDETPGFEVIPLLIAISFVILLSRRKRLR